MAGGALKTYCEFHFDWFRETNIGMCCYMCWESDLFAFEDFMKPFSQDRIAKTLSSNGIQKYGLGDMYLRAFKVFHAVSFISNGLGKRIEDCVVICGGRVICLHLKTS